MPNQKSGGRSDGERLAGSSGRLLGDLLTVHGLAAVASELSGGAVFCLLQEGRRPSSGICSGAVAGSRVAVSRSLPVRDSARGRGAMGTDSGGGISSARSRSCRGRGRGRDVFAVVRGRSDCQGRRRYQEKALFMGFPALCGGVFGVFRCFRGYFRRVRCGRLPSEVGTVPARCLALPFCGRLGLRPATISENVRELLRSPGSAYLLRRYWSPLSLFPSVGASLSSVSCAGSGRGCFGGRPRRGLGVVGADLSGAWRSSFGGSSGA